MRKLILSLFLLLSAAVVHADDAMRIDTDTLPPFHWTIKGFDATAKSGEMPAYFSANMWDGGSTGDVFLDEKPVHEAKAIGLRSLSGKGSVQLYSWQKFKLTAGRIWELTFDYYAEPEVAGNFAATGDNIEAAKDALSGTGGKWKSVKHRYLQATDGMIQLQFQNYSVGADKGLYLKNIRITDVGETKKTDASQGLLVQTNENSKLPDLKPDAVADPYYRSLIAELAPLHPKFILIGRNLADAMKSFGNLNSMGEGKASMTDVPAAGQPFGTAKCIVTEKKAMEWQTHIQSFTGGPIKRGDLLYLTAWVRAIKVTDGKNNGVGRLYASEEGLTEQNSSPLYAGDFSIPKTWERIHFPMIASRDFGPNDRVKLMFTFGHTSQTIEIGGICGIDFGAGLDKISLPHAALKLEYPGREEGAAWRKAAEARIEKLRKADLKIRVVDSAGKPIPGAQVKVTMNHHAFRFGSSLPIGMLPGQHVLPYNDDFKRTAGASDADKAMAQQTFLKLFNSACTSVTWTVWEGGDLRISRNDIMAGLKWLNANGITCYDTQSVYPSPEFTPSKVRPLMAKATASEFGKAVDAYIKESADTFYPYIASMEIANEIEGRPQYTDVLGRDAVVGWFNTAKNVQPKMLRMINGPYALGDANVTTTGRGAAWPKSDGLQYYYDLISWLKQKGAQIDYIGVQNHIGIGAPGPEVVLASLDQFAKLGYPIEVTEFEVVIQNGNDAKQRQYQADYVRDFLTAVFSHPAANGIILQDFWQPGAWQFEGASCFFNADWSVNPHGKAYMDLVLNKWWTKTGGQTGATGAFVARGFLGDYDVTVTAGGKTQAVKATLTKPGAALTIKM